MSESNDFTNGMTRHEWGLLRTKQFHRERVDLIRNDKSHVRLIDTTRLVIHFIPQEALTGSKARSAADLKNASDSIKPLGGNSANYGDGRYNAEGYLLFQGDEVVRNYSQLFRNGMYEGVMAEAVYDRGNGCRLLRQNWCEEAILDAMIGYLSFAKQLEFCPPFISCVSLLGCEGARMVIDQRFGDLSRFAVDRETVTFPESIIDSFDTDVEQHLRSTLDILWNCVGLEKSLNYDEHGSHKANRR